MHRNESQLKDLTKEVCICCWLQKWGCLPHSILDFHSLASFSLIMFGSMATLRRENPITELCLNFYHRNTPKFLTKWARRGTPVSACLTGEHWPSFLHSPQPAYCSTGEFLWLFSGSVHAHLPLLSPQEFCYFPAAIILCGTSVRGSCPLCVLLGGGDIYSRETLSFQFVSNWTGPLPKPLMVLIQAHVPKFPWNLMALRRGNANFALGTMHAWKFWK